MPEQDIFHLMAAAGDHSAEAGSTVFGSQHWACRIDGPITVERAVRYGFNPLDVAPELAQSVNDAGYIVRLNGRTAVRVVERFSSVEELLGAWALTVADLGPAPHAR